MDYCRLVRLFPSTSIEGALKTTISDHNRSLDQIINPTSKQINFEALPNRFEGNDRIMLQNIVDLITSQAPTCHQGIVVISLKYLCDKLQDVASDIPDFKAFIDYLARELSNKKDFANDKNLLFYTIFTFARNHRLPGDVKNEKSPQGFASEAINRHYYYLGADRTGPGVIELKKYGKTLEEKTGTEFKDFDVTSYFSNFKENSIMQIALWQSLFADLGGLTVASVVQSKFNKTPKYWKNAFQQSNESDPQEFMALFALAHASHKTLLVPVDGLELFENFARNVQIKSVQINAAPSALSAFLKTIKVPYLIPQEHNGPSLEKLREILPMGECRRTRNGEGIDVCFTIKDSTVDGFIECKNRKENVTRSMALEYIIKAINFRRPLAILMGKEVGTSVESEKGFNIFKRAKIDPPASNIRANTLAQASTTAIQPQANQTILNDLINSINLNDAQVTESMEILSFIEAIETDSRLEVHDFKMNIYSLTYVTRDTLEYAVLHETPNPNGVFIIVESDCTFK